MKNYGLTKSTAQVRLNMFTKTFGNMSSILVKRAKFLIFILIFILISLPSCSTKKQDEKPIISVTDSLAVNKEVKKLLGDDVKFITTGNFAGDSLLEIAAGIEIVQNNNWGIRFILLEIEDNELVKKYETNLLDGSFKESFVQKIKLRKFNHELVYYNSQDYFWGSGGGEVFAYVVDFNKQETYYAHLFSESRREVELFLSKNIDEPELRNFFVSVFKKDYPDLKLAAEDVTLEY